MRGASPGARASRACSASWASCSRRRSSRESGAPDRPCADRALRPLHLPAARPALPVRAELLALCVPGHRRVRHTAGAGPRRVARSSLQPLEPRRLRPRRPADAVPPARRLPLMIANILQPLIDVLHQVLQFFGPNGGGPLQPGTVGLSWGMAIIALTVTIRVILLPLTLKQSRSLRKMQVLQPQLKELQAKYKDDKPRLNEEMMKFYKEHKVNPLASCFPLILQLPFFISLFYMLRHDLRHDICGQTAKVCGDVPHVAGQASEGFLGIPDLTAPAHGGVLVVLLILYVGSQLISGIITMVGADKTQRNIMLALPVVFATFVVTFPAGLVVYWITTNVWTIFQQYLVRKRVGGPVRPAKKEEEGKAAPAGAPAVALASGGGGGGGSGGNGKPPPAPSNGAGTNGARAGGPPPPPRRRKKRSGR